MSEKNGELIVPPSRTTLAAELKGLSPDQLREQFAAGLRVTVLQLLRSSLILAELDARGELTPEGVSAGLLAVLRKIAAGELLAEVVVRFAGTPRVMMRVARLPVGDQEAVLADEDKVADLLRPRRARAVRDGVLTPAPGTHARKEDSRSDVESRHPLRIAEKSTVKDLAEMLAGMIVGHPDPAAVWAALLRRPELRGLKEAAP